MAKVSVILPTYNRAGMVGDAIDSVLGQTFRDLELFVVDDGSTDGTGEALKKRYGDRINYIYQEHGGVPPRNVAIEKAAGEYIAFIDSDDLFLPEKIEKQVGLLERSPKKTGVVYCSHYVQEGEDAPLKLYEAVHRGDVFERILLSELMFSPSRALVRKECFDKVGLFDETLWRSQDTDLWLRISRHYDIDYIKEPLLIKRQFGFHSMKNPAHIGDPLRHLDKLFSDPGCPDRIKRMRGEAYARRLLVLLDVYYMNNMALKVWGCFLRALFYSPSSVRKTHVEQFFKAPLRPFFKGSLKDRYTNDPAGEGSAAGGSEAP